MVAVLVSAACTAPAPVAQPTEAPAGGTSAASPTVVEVAAGSAAAPAETPSALTASAEAPAAASTPTAEPAAEAGAVVGPASAPAAESPTAAPSPAPASAAEAPTPSLAEALAARFPAAPTAQGEVILVTGRVLDRNGDPLPGAAVEFWQTDASGVYDHPREPGTEGRDRGFQFYGTAIADVEGRYVFRTIRPGYYAPRPRHIHVKVKLDGRTLLTTQFYFEEDRQRLMGEGVASRAGSLIGLLILEEVARVPMNAVTVPVLAKDLVVDTGRGSALTATPAQAEGPYYPVVPVANYDNDLAAVP
ncbi:MAG: hypothetical protein NZ528_11555 [Caldilineales bacterium]|nr:hypothetical protein [Caldilineales bacterium]